MKAQFDHSSLATSATATEGETEKEENPHHRVKDSSSKQASGLSVSQHATQHLFRAFLESASRTPVNVHMHS